MVEVINPVSSIVTGADDVSVDTRRYTQFDRSLSDTGVMDASFDDFVDTINPLQHIPVLSSLYRYATDETISPAARVIGDMAYSGPLGLVSVAVSGAASLVNCVVEGMTGKDILGTVATALLDDNDVSGSTQYAAAESTTEEIDLTANQAVNRMPASIVAVASFALPLQTARSSEKPAVQIAKSDDEQGDETAADNKVVAAPISPAAPQQVAHNVTPAVVGNKQLLPLDRSRMGVSSINQGDTIENQNRMIALNETAQSIRVGRVVYPGSMSNRSRLGNTTSVTNPQIIPPPPTPNDIKTQSAAMNTLLAQQGHMPVPNGFDDVAVLKQMSKYRDFANAPVGNGAALSLSN